MSRTVYDLSVEEMHELKEAYMMELADEGTFGEVVYDDESIESPSYGDLLKADELIPDSVIFEHYDGFDFYDDDFSCNNVEVA